MDKSQDLLVDVGEFSQGFTHWLTVENLFDSIGDSIKHLGTEEVTIAPCLAA